MLLVGASGNFISRGCRLGTSIRPRKKDSIHEVILATESTVLLFDCSLHVAEAVEATNTHSKLLQRMSVANGRVRAICAREQCEAKEK